MMKKILIGLFLSFNLSAFCQGNVTVKLITTRVIIKSFEGDEFYYKSYEKNSDKVLLIEELFKTKFKTDAPFGKIVYDAAVSGKITVYDPFLIEIRGYEMSFPLILSPTEIQSAFSYRDSVKIIDPNPPYNERDTLFSKDFNPNDVVAIDFAEQWFINTKTFEIKKKIIAIAPVLAVYSVTERTYRGLLQMFWIKM